MKNMKLIIFAIITSINIKGQNIDVENSTNNMLNVTLDINNPVGPCNEALGHKDNLSLPFDKEKQKNITNSSPYARSLRFALKFNSNCSYNLGNSNQLDWNKVMSIVQTNDNVILDNSFSNMRVGWRWNLTTNSMEVGFYAHIRHSNNNNPRREFFYLRSVDLETFYDTELIMGNSGMGIIVGDVGAYIKRRGLFEPKNGKVKTAFLRSAYFGGQECPPHKVAMRVKNIKGDKSKTNWHDGACEKTFARSIFYSDEVLVITAARKIIMSEQVYRGQYAATSNVSFNSTIPSGYFSGDEIPWFEADGNRYVIIESGSKLVCKAGEEIRLLPGFRAEYGSDFTAQLDNTIVCETFSHRPSDTDNEEDFNDELVNNETDKNDTDIKKIKLFPNPTNEVLNIDLEEERFNDLMSIEIIDVLGKRQLVEIASKVDVKNLTNGFYQIKFMFKDGNVIVKNFVKN